MEKFSGKKTGASEMAQAVEMQTLIRRIGWPLFPDEQRVFRIERAARKLGITARSAKAYWYGERATIPSNHMDKARRLAGVPIVEETRDDLNELRARISRLENALRVADEAFYSETLAALEQQTRRSG